MSSAAAVATPGGESRPPAWREYAIEGALLGLFMVSAGLFGTLLEAPGSPVRQALDDPFLRRGLMGLVMGLTAIALIRSPWGRRSGAHMNPAVTLTFLRLGKVEHRDAVGYIVGQCLGGLAGVLLVSSLAGEAFARPPVLHVVTTPGPGGPWLAFAAEVAISFLLMVTVLALANNYRLAGLTPYAAGVLVALYITFEAPLSGMSMNPARSLASAVPAGVWTSFWIYLVAPLLGMLTAAELYVRRQGLQRVLCAKLDHSDGSACPFRCSWCQHEAVARRVPAP